MQMINIKHIIITYRINPQITQTFRLLGQKSVQNENHLHINCVPHKARPPPLLWDRKKVVLSVGLYDNLIYYIIFI